jgi:hypothetical protein
MSQLGLFTVVCRNIAVLVNLAKVGKLAQTVFPGTGGDLYPPPSFEIQTFHCLDTGERICDLIPSW